MSKGPLVVVTSYTKFDNLAHSPEGIEAKQCIRTFRLDPSSGQLTLVSVYTDCEDSNNVPVMNPAFTRIHPSRNVIYSCTESVSDNGEIVAWDICPTSGKLSFLSSADAHGTSTCYITIDKGNKHALVVNYWNSTVVVLDIDKRTGAIKSTGKPKSIYDPNQGRQMHAKSDSHVSHSKNDTNTIKERQMDPHSHAIILDPFFGKIAFVPDLGMDLIRQLVFDPCNGILYPRGEIKSGEINRAALGPRYIEFHPTLSIAYVVNELSSEVAVFRFNQEKAKRIISLLETKEVDGSLHSPPEQCLELIQTISTIPTGYPNSLNTCGRITVHNTGRFVLVSNRGHNSICVLSVEKYSGLLQKPIWQHTRGATPRHFQFDPSGEWLVVANQDSNRIGIFHFSSSTGYLNWTGNEYHVPSPNFVCCVEPHIEQFDSTHDNHLKDSKMLAKLLYENM